MLEKGDELAEAFRVLAVSLTGERNTSVEICNEKDTGYVDDKSHIVVTTQVVPKELLDDDEVVRRLLEGLVVHECGHIIKTYPFNRTWEKWKNSQSNRNLARAVANIIEDIRVNYYMRNRYCWDVGKRLDLLIRVTKDSWITSLRESIASNPASPIMVALSAIAYGAVYDGDPQEVFSAVNIDIKKDIIQNAEAAISILQDEAAYAITDKDIINLAQRVYDLLLIDATGEKENLEQLLPNWMTTTGEGMETHCSEDVASSLKNEISGETDDKGEEEGQEEGKEENKENGNGDLTGVSAGSGTGLAIPSPTPNEENYLRLVEHNMPIIQQMLKRFRIEENPRMKNNILQKSGRLMSEIIGLAYVNSLRRPLENIYSRRTLQLEKGRMKIGLVIDLSGSMRIQTVQNVLTVIAEVISRKLDDQDFAIITFGSDYQRIKAFIESWHNTKARIGNLYDLGGTVLNPPLIAMEKMMAGVEPNYRKMVIIVSDFIVSDGEEVMKTIARMTKNDIAVMGIGLCQGDLVTTKLYCGELATYVADIHQLPELFFEIYRRVCGYKVGRAKLLGG